MNKLFQSILLSAALAIISGCTNIATLYNVPKQTVQTNKDAHTATDVKKAIIRAGTTLGWQMYAEKPGNVVGTLHIRVHTAVVDISYDANSYSVAYKDSDLLKYHQETGPEYTDKDGNTHIKKTPMIHKNYNVWIKDLDRAIKLQLLAI